MGRPKLLLPWGDTTVIEHALRQWENLHASQIAAIVAAGNPSLPKNIPQITNPVPDRGMFSSVRCAADWPHWNPALTHFVISLGDQPHLREATLGQLVHAARQQPDRIWQPSHAGRRRHPVVLPRSSFHALRETAAPDLKTFLESFEELRQSVDIDDPGLDIDLDTPEDYERAKRLPGPG